MQIKATSYTPNVSYNIETSCFEIQGRSFPENAKDFYLPILDWLTNLKVSSTLTFRINLEYFNTASSKFLLEMLNAFYKIKEEQSVSVLVQWVYANGDEDMKEAGQEFDQIVNIPFEYVQIENS